MGRGLVGGVLLGVSVGLGVTVGVGVVVAVAVGVAVGPISSRSVKASGWYVPLMGTRPSTHEERCLVAKAEA